MPPSSRGLVPFPHLRSFTSVSRTWHCYNTVDSCRRLVHTSTTKHAAAVAPPHSVIPTDSLKSRHHMSTADRGPRPNEPLSILPLSQVVRTYLITSMSSSPHLIRLTFAVINRMLASNSALFNIDRNPLLRFLFKRTFYTQFCAGESPAEVQRTLERLRAQGYSGVMLEFALEVLKGGKVPAADSAQTLNEINKWKQGMLQTIKMASGNDIVGLKWSGLGVHALNLLKRDKPPTPEMDAAITEVCDAAAAKGVGLFPGAEEEITNVGIDNWTMALQERYNTTRPIMYTTYQCYLRSTPKQLARHLARAKVNGHVLGVKLVRGAYLGMEPKSQVCSSKEETDRVYDALAERLLRRSYGGILQPLHGAGCSEMPDVDLVLATHNAPSVRKAMAVRRGQLERGERRTPTSYIQLMGMADDVSCEILCKSKAAVAANAGAGREVRDVPRAMKCATWGTLTECLHFLLRRAAENQDAMSRTDDSRRAMGREIWRRLKVGVGLV